MSGRRSLAATIQAEVENDEANSVYRRLGSRRYGSCDGIYRGRTLLNLFLFLVFGDFVLGFMLMAEELVAI